MLTGYPQGSDITIMNTMYHYPKKDQETGKWDKGAITLVAKDNQKGFKFTQTIENPDFEFFVAKEDVNIDHNLFFIEKDMVDKVTVPYVDLEKNIAEIVGATDFYYDNIKNGNRYANKMLHTHNRVFRSDMHIEDYYRLKFAQTYQNNITPITKAYLDIEADTIHMKGDFPEPGECPINAVTVIDDKTNSIYTFLLRNPNNPLIQKFEDELGPAFFEELKQLIIDNVGSMKQFVKYKLDKLKPQILFYDDEIKMLHDLFNMINVLQPDFVLAWNMSFDVPYIIQRIINLGYDPRDIICHPDFDRKECKYFIDERAKNEFAERCDLATISSYSVYLDQMIQFASRRKGQGVFPSYSLDSIGSLIAGCSKLSYKHITTDIAQLPYLDYKTFVMYNIVDVITQKCIEEVVEDIDYVFSKVIGNNTRYAKIHRQTVYLTNRATTHFDNEGFIIGNNVNKNNEKPPKFPGAFVADPVKLSDYPKQTVNRIPVSICDNADDFDYARLYPSMLQEFNMAPNTQVGMIHIEQQIHNKENRTHDEKYSRSGTFIENLASKNYLEFCTRWLKLGSYEDLYDDIIEYYTKIKTPIFMLRERTDQGLIIPIRRYHDGELIKPIFKTNPGTLIKPVTRYIPYNNKVMGDLRDVYNSNK